MLRRDEEKLGRVEELQSIDRQMKEQRKIFSEEVVSKKEEKVEREKGETAKKGRGRGKRKRVEEEEEDDEGDGEGEK